MPMMDGYEETRLIRMEEKSYGVHIPVIVLTAAMAEEEKTIGAGMDFHSSKPLDVPKLLQIIHSLDRK
ncbi:hypothetical protein V6N13_014402 [Hibiscus sabdariffa]|uniref:histidine kinase n=1 Tax=Hibiscus sabdariffa TaxID=183260 RepID=A0ABR2RVJ3_9ROSI